MPELLSLWLREQFKLMKPLLRARSNQADRNGQDLLGKLAVRSFGERVVYVHDPLTHCSADWAYPSTACVSQSPILYLHGGGYTAGSLEYARGFGGILAERTNRRVYCVGYRLAPEHPFPAALDDAREAYLHLLDEVPAERILLAGESAGGGLCFALLHDLRQRGIPFPAGIIAVSPWTDLTMSGDSYRANEKVDPTLHYERLKASADAYAGEDLQNPLVSPLFGDFHNFPPALIFAGGDELLLDDSVSLYNRYIRCGSVCTLHIEEGMWHVYVLFGLPESKIALAQIQAFCDGLVSSPEVNADGEA